MNDLLTALGIQQGQLAFQALARQLYQPRCPHPCEQCGKESLARLQAEVNQEAEIKAKQAAYQQRCQAYLAWFRGKYPRKGV